MQAERLADVSFGEGVTQLELGAFQLSQHLCGENAFNEAIACFERAASLADKAETKGRCYFQSALAYEKLGRSREAIERFHMAMTVAPSSDMNRNVNEHMLKFRAGYGPGAWHAPIAPLAPPAPSVPSAPPAPPAPVRTNNSSNNNINININGLRQAPDQSPTPTVPPQPNPGSDSSTPIPSTPDAAEALPVAAEAPHSPSTPTIPSQPTMARALRGNNRWGDGVDAPKAGARLFFPSGWTPDIDIWQALEAFDTRRTSLDALRQKGEVTLRRFHKLFPAIALCHLIAVLAYTEENELLYPALNRAMRTPGQVQEMFLQSFRPFIFHLDAALHVMPRFSGEVYRGLNVRLAEHLYEVGRTVTWQQFSSTTKLPLATLGFLQKDGRKLSGSLFVCRCDSGWDICEFSDYPNEEEVLFSYNTFWNVVDKPESAAAKQELLGFHFNSYDVTDLDVYVLRQIS